MYLDNLACDDDQWPKTVKWTQKQRVRAANELPEDERPKPCIKVKQEAVTSFSQMLRDRCPGIPANTITNLVRIFGAADLINAAVPGDIYTSHLPTMRSTAGTIPDLERLNPKPPFGGSASYTWGLVHGTSVSGAISILLEGLIRPADWEHHNDPKKSQLPTFGLFSMGTQLNRGDSEIPRWVAQTLLDRAAKRGKGQQPVLVGALYRGKHEYAALKLGAMIWPTQGGSTGSGDVQRKVWWRTQLTLR